MNAMNHLRFVLLCCVLPGHVAPVQAQRMPDDKAPVAAPVDRLARAEAWNEVMQQLADARGRVYRTGRDAVDLNETAARLASAAPLAERALDSLGSCLGGARQAERRLDMALGGAEAAGQAHRTAVAAVAMAPEGAGANGAVAAQAALDAATRRRTQTDREAGVALQAAADHRTRCEQLDLSAVPRRVLDVADWARETDSLPAHAQDAAQALAEAGQAALALAALAGAGPAGNRTAGQPAPPIRAANEALARVRAQPVPKAPPHQPVAVGAQEVALLSSPVRLEEARDAWQKWTAANWRRFGHLQRLAVVDDAALFVRVAAADPGCGSACLREDAVEQARERSQTLDEAATRQRERAAAEAGLQERLERWQAAAEAARRRVAAGDGGSADAVNRWAQATQDGAQALEDALVATCEAELRDTDEAQVCAPRGIGGTGSTAKSATEWPGGYAELSLGLLIHAYAWVQRWDEEPREFGAYTYVLLRGSVDRQSPQVRERLARLLTELESLPEAATVARDQRVKTNVFVLPGQGTDLPHKGYDTRLAQALMARAQGAVLLQPAVRGRLLGGPGPFLVTLPVRIAEATGSTPLLLADLSQTPPDAVTDLARSYMGGLVDRFPIEQENWRPPAGQVVAIWMLRVAANTGQLIETVIPSAPARSTR